MASSEQAMATDEITLGLKLLHFARELSKRLVIFEHTGDMLEASRDAKAVKTLRAYKPELKRQ
jgi:hypothetical protein